MDKFCRYCVKDLPIDNFEDGLKTCKTCLEYKRKNYDKHKDKVNETRRTKYKEDEEYRKKKQEQIQNYRDKVAFCNVCNSSMKAQCYSRHLKTEKHKRNLGTVEFCKMNKVIMLLTAMNLKNE